MKSARSTRLADWVMMDEPGGEQRLDRGPIAPAYRIMQRPDQILVSEVGLCLGASFLLYVGHVYWLQAVRNADNRTKATIFFILAKALVLTKL